MAESPKRPVDASRAEASRVVKPVKPVAATNETARASDSVPLAIGPFTELPTQFGRYRIEKLLGKGAMGAVYLALDGQLDRPVALKVARVSATGSVKAIQRMETEAKAAAKIDHPLICKVYDFGEIEGIRFIAMQHIEGEDLKSYLKRVGRRRSPTEAIRWTLQIAGALKAAHEQGVMHRDLKPENVMLNRNGEPVIMDFGLARHMSGVGNAGLTQGMILGTAAYMSPEQAAARPEGIDHRCDLYALGVILFEMLTGEWPFSGSAMEVMGRKCVLPAPSPLSLNPDLPPRLAEICLKLIAQKKEDRFANCAELIAVLEQIDLKAPTTPKPESIPSTIAIETSPSFDFLNEKPAASNSVGNSASNTHPSSWPPSTLQRSTRKQTRSTSVARWAAVGGIAIVVVVAAAFMIARNSERSVKQTALAEKGGGITTLRSNSGHKDVGDPRNSTNTDLANESPRISDSTVASGPLSKSVPKEPSSGDATIPSAVHGTAPSPAMTKIPQDAVAFQEKRFKLFTDQLSWHEAQKKCQEMGGRLAEVRSAAENAFLQNLAQNEDVDGVWLGATDEVREGRWVWSDGSELTYKNWSRLGKQPNNGGRSQNEHFLMMMIMREAGKWSDQPATPLDWAAGYICEWSATGAPERAKNEFPK